LGDVGCTIGLTQVHLGPRNGKRNTPFRAREIGRRGKVRRPPILLIDNKTSTLAETYELIYFPEPYDYL
jgi:hypothetical protein